MVVLASSSLQGVAVGSQSSAIINLLIPLADSLGNSNDINLTAGDDISVFAEDAISMTAGGTGAASAAFSLLASNGDVRIASGSPRRAARPTPALA